MTFVGFGLGAIQTGLFLYEAKQSGLFERLVVAEVDAALVRAASAARRVSVNIAHPDGIETAAIDGVELLDPGDAAGRRALVEAAAAASELATAVPSVAFYGRGGAASPASVIGDALGRAERPRVVYAAENHNRAAGMLAEAIGAPAARPGFQALDTVIGKMSGVVSDPAEIAEVGLAPLAPGVGRAALVEEFNRILISRITLPAFRRGLAVFEEKDDLLPYEEAKLFGHNAIHCLVGFLAHRRGYALMSEALADREIADVAREAFILESGAALVAKHRGLGDRLFTGDGFAAYAEDLIERMGNPWLRDRVERVCRDPQRKLGYGDRLFGAMRLALTAGIHPVRLALGARAGVEHLAGRTLDAESIRAILGSIWSREPADEDGLADECVRLVVEAGGSK